MLVRAPRKRLQSNSETVVARSQARDVQGQSLIASMVEEWPVAQETKGCSGHNCELVTAWTALNLCIGAVKDRLECEVILGRGLLRLVAQEVVLKRQRCIAGD